MSAQTGSSSVWVWCPVDDGKNVPFEHPSNVPSGNEATRAKACFIDKLRGPLLARISPVTLLQTNGNTALIAECGATREVPKQMVLPWYEGLLLLEELEAVQGQSGHIHAKWCGNELKQVLEQERRKFRNGQLSGALYTERRLANIAVTGSRFVDADDREWAYRRENLCASDKSSVTEGEERGEFFPFRDITGYLPPWQAFCNEKCGFYQDFYQLLWEYPFSEVDYAPVENGCLATTGATWEPDECLPAHLDSHRFVAKRAWIKRRREQEQKIADEKNRARFAQQLAPKRLVESEEEAHALKRQHSDYALLRQRSDSQAYTLIRQSSDAGGHNESQKDVRAEERRPKRTRTRRDGLPLERDLFHSAYGHDFAPGDTDKNLGGIRTGWPKHQRDYPKGYGVANPPGFCWDTCDCMDDQRPQRSWETHKAWLEDSVRSTAALSTIETFSAQTRFVRRRGQVSKLCFFETATAVLPDSAHRRAALDLARTIEREMSGVLNFIPIDSLKMNHDPIRIPAKPFLSETLDYEPVHYEIHSASGSSLPQWAQLDVDNGFLSTTDPNATAAKLFEIRVDFSHSEGVVGTATCSITPEKYSGSMPPWAVATAAIIKRFNDHDRCKLEKDSRLVLLEHFAELYDFKLQIVMNKALGDWLEVMARILHLLRTSAVTFTSLTAAHTIHGKANEGS